LRFPRIRKRKRLKRSKLFRSPLLRALRKVSPKSKSLLKALNRASLSLRIVHPPKKKSNQSNSQSRLTLRLRLIRITTGNSPTSNSRDLMATNRLMRFSLDNSISMLRSKTLRTSSKVVETSLLLSYSEMMMEDLKGEDLLSLAMKTLSRRLYNSKEKILWEDPSKSKSQEKETTTNKLRDLTIDSKVENQVKSLKVSSLETYLLHILKSNCSNISRDVEVLDLLESSRMIKVTVEDSDSLTSWTPRMLSKPLLKLARRLMEEESM
jgi:hypothetical protein